MEIPADVPSRFVITNGIVHDTEPDGQQDVLTTLDPAIIEFVARCLNAADSIMRCTGSISATHIEADPRGTGIEYGFYVTRFSFNIYDANLGSENKRWICSECGFNNEPATCLCHGCGWDSAR